MILYWHLFNTHPTNKLLFDASMYFLIFFQKSYDSHLSLY